MHKSTRNVANEMGLHPISIWCALKLILKGAHVGFCFGYRTKKGVKAIKIR